MQVNSLFAVFFAFLALVAPLASALTITLPSNMTTGNNTISCTDSNVTGSLYFFVVRNSTQDPITEGVNPNLGQVQVTIPSNVSGDGWRILAKTFDNQTVGQSSTFSIVTTSAIATNNPASGPNVAGAVVGGVIGGIVAVSLVVFLVFLYLRRRRQQSASNPTFNLEAGFTAAQHSRSFSSTMNSDMDRGFGSKSLDLDKIQWERELEEQFARARSGTPDVLRGASPMPRPGSRNTSPPRGVSPMPLVPQRALSRD